MVKANRREENGWIKVTISGSPYQLGFSHGSILSKEIRQVIDTMDFTVPHNWGYSRKDLAEIITTIYKDTIENKYPDYYREIEGIVAGANSKGAKVTFEDILLWNCWYSLDYISAGFKQIVKDHPELKSKYGDYYVDSVEPMLKGGRDRCSGFIAVGDWTHDGKIVCAHNTFDNFIDAQQCNIMMTVKPNKGNSFLMQTAPGQICSGTDYYVTSNGFIVTETTIGGFNAFEVRDPVCVRIRKAVQYSKKLDDFVEILKDGNGGDYANSWLVGDVKNNEIMRIELGLRFVNVEKKKNGYFIGFNAPYDPKIRNIECSNTGMFDIRRHQGARQVRLTQLMKEHKGKIDEKIGQEILADHYDVYLNKVNPCSRTCCSHYELDQREFMCQIGRPLPYQPRGAIDGIVSSSRLARKMGLCARWGSSCGTPFIVKDFAEKNIQYEEECKYLMDRPYQPWTVFTGRKSKGTRKNNKKSSKKQTKRR